MTTPFTIAFECVIQQEYSLLITFDLYIEEQKNETYKGVGCMGSFLACWIILADVVDEFNF